MTTTTNTPMHTPRYHRRSLAAFLLTAVAVLNAVVSAPPASADDHGHGHEEEGGDPRGHGEEGGHDHEEAASAALDMAVMREFGVTAETAGPGKVRVTLTLNGGLVAQEDRVAHVTPRYPGVIREVRKRLGDAVKKGDVVAVVEGNQSLQPYDVTAPLTGTVVQRHATVGEFAGEGTAIFEVADYGELFADLYVFPTDFLKVRIGQIVSVRIPALPAPVETTISFLSPVTNPLTQSRFVRAVVSNEHGTLQPGMFVTGDVVLEEADAAVVIDASAVRSGEGKPVVFVEHDGKYEPRPVTLGRTGRDTVEVTKGLSAGERYAAGNTFVLQAELEKGEAEHEH